LELAKQHLPRLVLLDHMMPELDGIEVCRRLREHSPTRETPIIILTARADDRTKLEALRAGASDFLTKPFSSAELSLRIENQLAMGRYRRELAEANRELKSALDQLKENEVLLVRNEKLSALGRMSAGIIHEINNPLNYARAGIHTLDSFGRQLPETERPEFAEVLGDIREGVERVSQIVSDLRQFTRDSGGNDEEVALHDVVDRAARLFSHEFGNGMRLDNLLAHEVVVDGNRNQLVQVFVNFLQNSIDAIHERVRAGAGEAGVIEVAAVPTLSGGWDVVVRDNGSGIPPEVLPKIFDPFFTSKDVGKGMGLGLSITHRILERHHAAIDVDSRPGRTEFRLNFPRRRGLPPLARAADGISLSA
jgi:C4-dicarboxylate-specific signal transduction histidine kinase